MTSAHTPLSSAARTSSRTTSSHFRSALSRAVGRIAGVGLVGSLLLGGCLAEEPVATQTGDTAGTCSVQSDKFGVHVGAVAFSVQSHALSQTDGGWVRVLHQFKRCNDRLPPQCPQTAGWNCAQGNGKQADLDDWVELIDDYHDAGRKVLLNVNGWAIPACVEDSASHPPAAPQNANGGHADQWLNSYRTELTRLVQYLDDKGALPDAIQVGNEPNGIEDMNCAFFGRMLQAADEILRTEAPGVLRVTGGVINPWPHQMGGQCLNAAAAEAKLRWQASHPGESLPNNYMAYQGVAVHMYGVRGDNNYRVDNNGAVVRQRWNEAVGSLNSARFQFGPNPKIWVTETGGPLNESSSSQLSEDYKADFLRHTLPHLASKSEVERVFIYRLLSGGEHLGLFQSNGQTKNDAADVVNSAVCGGIDPNGGGSSSSSGGGTNCSAQGWCQCPQDASKWYDQNATSGPHSKAVKCDGQTSSGSGGGATCNNGWCQCPNDPSTWYDQGDANGPNSKAVKCDGQTGSGGGATCNNGWCQCPDNPGVWYDQNDANGPNSKAVKCDGQTGGGGPICNNGWCQCPNNPNVWYEESAMSGPNSQAEKCG